METEPALPEQPPAGSGGLPVQPVQNPLLASQATLLDGIKDFLRQELAKQRNHLQIELEPSADQMTRLTTEIEYVKSVQCDPLYEASDTEEHGEITDESSQQASGEAIAQDRTPRYPTRSNRGNKFRLF